MGAVTGPSDAGFRAAAREASARGDSFEVAAILRPRRVELDGDDLELLAEAEWWLGNLDTCIEVRQEAYERCIAADERSQAADLALKLTADYGAKNAPSQAAGWHRRATRLLRDIPEGALHGYLLHQQVWDRYRRDDPGAAIAAATSAAQLAETYGDVNLHAYAMMDLGRVLLHAGKADEALPLIEEACAAAVGGELSRYVTGIVFCQAIVTFQELTDYGRASEWADAASRWCERRAQKGFPGLCRIHRAEAMRLRGAWAEASVQAEQACSELLSFAPGWARGAFRELAIIRLRLGDLAGAEQAVEEARALGSNGQPSLAMVCMAKGDPHSAVSGLRETLTADDWSDLDRAPCLAVLVEAALGAGEPGTAELSAGELRSTADRYGTPVLEATAAEATGRVALAGGDGATAVAALRNALGQYAALDLPYETARVRTLLARGYVMTREPGLARQEVTTAQQVFRRLGASADADAAVELLSDIGRPREATAALMFTDICESTPLVELLGDDAWSHMLSWHDAMLRGLFAEFGGAELDHAGDGFFVAFDDAADAIRCAIAIQRRLRQHRVEQGFAPDIRIGVHQTDARRAGNSVRGKGVHEAARIGASAGPGEILVSEATLATLRQAVDVARRETVTLKGLKEPIALASVRWETHISS